MLGLTHYIMIVMYLLDMQPVYRRTIKRSLERTGRVRSWRLFTV